jgi:amino acid adenylation domain-containing protein
MGTMAERPAGAMHAAFAAQARRRPHAVAVIHRQQRVTYAQLDERANFLAIHLRDGGVGKGDVVALSMQRSIEMLVAMLAILKCGAAYLPLDDSNPPSRTRLCLDDACVTHIIADRAGDPLYTTGRRVIDAADASLFESAAPQAPSVAIEADDRAYVMFTSGSTGKPKGVVVPHRAVLRLVLKTNYVEIDERDTVLQFSPTSFDASTFEIWGALLNGATLVLYSEETLDPNALRRDIAAHGVSVMWLTAALFHLIAHRYVEALAPVKVLLAGGDVLSPEAINKVLDALPGITVINGYGPTENTTFTCCHRMTAANRPPAHVVPIGKPITGTEVFVLDEKLLPVGQGEVGQLFAAGSGVALGYLQADPEQRFFRDPRIADGLIYRTGDLVRHNAAGELEFVGRIDNQIKIRGFRVSLEEIELSLLQIAGVVDAIVVPRKEPSGDQLLVAHIEAQHGVDLDLAQVRRHLAKSLPRYMIPDRIVLTAALPITRNGKLDRSSLLVSTS